MNIFCVLYLAPNIAAIDENFQITDVYLMDTVTLALSVPVSFFFPTVEPQYN